MLYLLGEQDKANLTLMKADTIFSSVCTWALRKLRLRDINLSKIACPKRGGPSHSKVCAPRLPH